jgi:hypothetical protein
MPTPLPSLTEPLAAIDMGSNSFRLEIGQLQHGRYRRLDYLKEMVRLGGGLDASGMLTDDAAEALSRLADAGIPLGNQSVMLRGVNEKPEVFKELNRKLLANRVRPYYIYQADLVEGTGHFRCSIDDGLNVVRGLRGHTSGMAVPQFVIDAPGGGGKIPLLPEEYSCRSENGIMLQNFRGEQFYYPDRKPDEHLRLVVEGSEDGNGQQRITAGTLPGEAPAETVPAPLARAFQWKDRGRHSRRRMVNR